MRYFEPGEILTKIQKYASSPTLDPQGIDIVLYIEYILGHVPISTTQKISINGECFVSVFQDPRTLWLTDREGKALFIARREEDRPWEIVTFNTTEDNSWVLLLEYAYEKTRTCMTSAEKFVNEFPPMGIV